MRLWHIIIIDIDASLAFACGQIASCVICLSEHIIHICMLCEPLKQAKRQKDYNIPHILTKYVIWSSWLRTQETHEPHFERCEGCFGWSCWLVGALNIFCMMTRLLLRLNTLMFESSSNANICNSTRNNGIQYLYTNSIS